MRVPAPLYAERSPSRRAWLVLLVLLVALYGGITIATGDPGPGLPVVLILGAVVALAMWSTGFYGNVTLTPDELRAGRARVALADVHPWGVSPEGERPQGRLVGGAFASSMDRARLGLTLRSGERIVIQTTDPRALRTALERALEPFRASS